MKTLPDFSESAEEIRVDIEAGQPILRAMLRTENGEFEARDLNLTERISNRDGQLCFGESRTCSYYEFEAGLSNQLLTCELLD